MKKKQLEKDLIKNMAEAFNTLINKLKHDHQCLEYQIMTKNHQIDQNSQCATELYKEVQKLKEILSKLEAEYSKLKIEYDKMKGPPR